MKTGHFINCFFSGLMAVICILACGPGRMSYVCAAESGPKAVYFRISQEEAKEMMAEDGDRVVLDVRTQEEFDSGHIPGAVCIPNESIGTEQPEELPDLDQIILIYCRSGRRSKEAAQKLADIGYTNIYEFGGIIDWTGEVVTENRDD